MVWYYMDDNNKVQVTEIYDVTDTERHAILSPDEVELNTKLQFDEWDEPTWLSQHTLAEGTIFNTEKYFFFLYFLYTFEYGEQLSNVRSLKFYSYNRVVIHGRRSA